MLYLRAREGALILMSRVGCSLGVKKVLFVNGSLKWGGAWRAGLAPFGWSFERYGVEAKRA